MLENISIFEGVYFGHQNLILKPKFSFATKIHFWHQHSVLTQKFPFDSKSFFSTSKFSSEAKSIIWYPKSYLIPKIAFVCKSHFYVWFQKPLCRLEINSDTKSHFLHEEKCRWQERIHFWNKKSNFDIKTRTFYRKN